jgi:hypothetical protein
VATAIDSLGWSAEFEIPLSQLRYADAPSHSFGIGVFRQIRRLAERVGWPLVSRNRPGLVSQLGTVENLVGLGDARGLEVTPYLLTKSETRPESDGFGRAEELTAGADVKLRVTPNLTLDATINPDFGQVEADPAVLNLDAFEVFLAERRPFFVEGVGLYRLPLNCYIVVDCGTNEGLFYPRRIGRPPALGPTYGDRDTPLATPIAAAGKLTGRTAGGLSFGVLNSVTRRVTGAGGATVEPTTIYTAASASQDLRGGEASIQVIGTLVNRAEDEWTAPALHSDAGAVAVSFRNRFGDGNYEVAGLFAASRVGGTAEAIALTQRNAVHYYQQPGDELAVDPARRSLSGTSAQVKFGKYGGNVTRFETSFVQHSAGFEVNDLGFLRRSDLRDWSTWAALNFNNPRRAYRWLRVNGNTWTTWNTSGDLIQGAVNFNAHSGLHNNWDVHAGFSVDGLGGAFCDRCSRGGPLVRRSLGVRPWFGVNTDNRRLVASSLWVNLGFGDEGRTTSVSLEPGLTFRFSSRLEARIGSRLVRNEDASQWVRNFPGEAGSTHHAFAHLDQRTVSATLRVNYTASPDLTFQFYGEPFVSRGTYADFRELSSTPEARNYQDRYVAYTPPATSPTGFHVRQVKTNLVVRWEYASGSTLFLVWAHGRAASSGAPSPLEWSGELDDLFDLHPSNTFLVKVAHWLNW